MRIRLSQVLGDSIVDGIGLRLVIFTQGCNHKCKGCHNPETHSITGGKEVSVEKLLKLISEDKLIDGITLSGGEPFLQAKECAYIAEKVKEMGLNVWTYSGYTFEQILNSNNEDFLNLLKNTDVLVDGKFILEQRSLDLNFRGSKNQRIIDVEKSLVEKKPVIFMD